MNLDTATKISKLQAILKELFLKNFITIAFLALYSGFMYSNWNTEKTLYDFTDQLRVMLYVLLSIIAFYIIAIIIFKLQNKFSVDNQRDINYQVLKLIVLYNESIWKTKDFWIIFIPILLVGMYFINYSSYYVYWFYLLILVLLLLIISRKLNSDKYIITVILASILVTIVLFIIINYQTLGIYYVWSFTEDIPLLNHGYEDGESQLQNIDEFYSITQWEQLDSPTPAGYDNLVFKAWGVFDNMIFYSYPIFIFVIIYNSLSILADTIIHNILKN